MIPNVAIIGLGRIGLTQESLNNLYWEQDLSQLEIAKKFGVSQQTIWRSMKQFGIKSRSRSESRVGKRNPFYGKQHTKKTRDHLSEIRYHPLPNQELTKLYTEQKLSTEQIGEIFHVSGKKVTNDLRRFGIPIRARGGKKGNTNPSCNLIIRKKISRIKKGRVMPAHVWGQIITKPRQASHKKHMMDEIVALEQQGFRCIPLIDAIPDIIAIKDNKVYAIEIELSNPNYEKYANVKSFDDIIWIIHREWCKN